MAEKIDCRRARAEVFPDSWRTGVINLNAGSCSPTPAPVSKAAEDLRLAQAKDPVHFIWRVGPKLLEESRRALADYLNANATNLLLTANATYAANTVLRSFPFASGDEILTTDQEYHHFLTLLGRVCREKNVTVRKVHLPLQTEKEETPAGIAQAIGDAIGSKTRMLLFSHGTSATGMILPAREICAVARAKGVVTFVDGAHAPGLVPVDVGGLDADFYAANLHKWVMGAIGSAFLHVSPRSRNLMAPLITTSTFDYAGQDADEPTAAGPTHWQASHEYQGTQDRTAQMVIGDAIRFRTRIGDEEVYARTRKLRGHCLEAMEKTSLTLLSQNHPDLQSAMVSYEIPRVDTIKLWIWLRDEHKIELAFPQLEDDRSVLRISNAWWNLPEEVDRLASILKDMDWRPFQSG